MSPFAVPYHPLDGILNLYHPLDAILNLCTKFEVLRFTKSKLGVIGGNSLFVVMYLPL